MPFGFKNDPNNFPRTRCTQLLLVGVGPDAPSGFRFANSDCNRDICRIVYLADVPNQRRDTTLSPAVSRGFPDVPPGFAPEL